MRTKHLIFDGQNNNSENADNIKEYVHILNYMGKDIIGIKAINGNDDNTIYDIEIADAEKEVNYSITRVMYSILKTILNNSEKILTNGFDISYNSETVRNQYIHDTVDVIMDIMQYIPDDKFQNEEELKAYDAAQNFIEKYANSSIMKDNNEFLN